MSAFNVAGVEAVGVVIAVGAGVTSTQVGDLVAYAGQPLGSYAEEQNLPADKVVPVPPSIDPVIGASIMLKGMTTRFLLRHCFKVSFYIVQSLQLKEVFLFSPFICCVNTSMDSLVYLAYVRILVNGS